MKSCSIVLWISAALALLTGASGSSFADDIVDCSHQDEIIRCVKNQEVPEGGCRMWYSVRKCLLRYHCPISSVQRVKSSYERKIQKKCDGGPGTLNYRNRDPSDEHELQNSGGETGKDCLYTEEFALCAEGLDPDSPVCRKWKSMRTCLENAGCSSESVLRAKHTFEQMTGDTCELEETVSRRPSSVSADYFPNGSSSSVPGHLQVCVAEAFKETTFCNFWRHVKECFVGEGYFSDKLIKYMQKKIFQETVTVGVFCGDNEDEDTGTEVVDLAMSALHTHCKSPDHLLSCFKIITQKAMSCSDLEEVKSCVLRSGCSETFAELLAEEVQRYHQLSCEKDRIEPYENCMYPGVVRECSEARKEPVTTCAHVKYQVACMKKGGCAKIYIATIKARLEDELKLFCGKGGLEVSTVVENAYDFERDFVTECKDEEEYWDCAGDLDTSQSTCRQWTFLRECLERADCTEKSIGKARMEVERRFQVYCQEDATKNMFVLCKKPEEGFACVERIVNSFICKNKNFISNCMMEAECPEALIKKTKGILNKHCDADTDP